MKHLIYLGLLLTGICLFAANNYAGVSKSAADMSIAEPPHDPKKKKAGEECKTSDECQAHQRCQKHGEKAICTEPVRVMIPNT